MASLLAVAGAFKIPSPIAGGEFQLSAPLAVLLCAVFGWRRYFIAGIIASAAALCLGLATPLNIAVALIFRFTAGAIISIAPKNKICLIVAGPVGTISSRAALALLLGLDFSLLVAAAVPGMLFTATAVCFTLPLAKRIVNVGACQVS